VNAVICIGVLIKGVVIKKTVLVYSLNYLGETHHYEYISEAVSCGIMRVGIKTVEQ
jgi:6,7-dimethyl-8-ribityllumazine synthase